MAVKVFIGKQTAEKVKATQLLNMGATDFNLAETASKVQSEIFQSIAAKGDSHVSKIETSGGIPIEISKKVLELLLPGLSYKEATKIYKMSAEKPTFYTVVLSDIDNNEKWEYVDCCINSLSIKLEMGGYVTGEIDIIGKTYAISTGLVTEDVATERGKSLLALHSEVSLEGVSKTASVESLDITVNNGLEGKGSLNSQYTVKITRSKPQETSVNLSMNDYDKVLFASMKSKMLTNANASAIVTLGDGSGTGNITIDILRMFVSENKRGDYKGAGTHDLVFEASADNLDKSHLKFTFAV